MSYQVITKMAYNAETRQIETWRHSNNVWPRTDYFYSLDATDDNIFDVVKWVARGEWQTRKWAKAFNTLFVEFPSLRYWLTKDEERRGLSWPEYCAVGEKWDAETLSNKTKIVARFRELTKIA